MESVKIGIVGTGGISHIHGKQLGELKNARIVAIADPNIGNRDTFIKSFNLDSIAQFDDHLDMLENIPMDAVLICSPHTLHYKQAMDAINHNCHVLIEKPMACSLEEAEHLIEIAKKANRVLQVSYQRHFEPAFLYIREAISSGTIGNLTSVTASLYQDWKHLTTGTWRQYPSLSGGGMLMDSGSHIVDVLLWTTGLKPIEVESKIEQHHTPVEQDSFTSIRFENNVVAGLNIVGNAPCWHETYVFCGENGAIFFDNGKIVLRLNGKEPVIPELPQQTTNSDKSFIDAILGHHNVMVPGDFAKEVVKLTERIYQSAGYKSITSIQ
ncbi:MULTISPECIES: Gfo/Idh/MocA family protein [Metabacillus]|uniref:Gfo/Idh/MocA family oxidoreductase n=1 Tax=Metabacillus hrfriensis TaxID=3048891 RepID=A0ACD4R6G8_9BACI|nr:MULTISPECIES: Gfo/Idh/MocA family oxidoreductase [Metabacillus]UAL50581.1 Gfo/Idh/MocA family oxidoreductase [Metabacillus dongyingensis]USK26845.1 Gfo/Idh/MocA family oxidoreductase [Bacillus sp. CMF21]WHZ56075.1 Gfo/Idh/MocA family oxidoreductase [Metabacillus sp. CT-WN-B3]